MANPKEPSSHTLFSLCYYHLENPNFKKHLTLVLNGDLDFSKIGDTWYLTAPTSNLDLIKLSKTPKVIFFIDVGRSYYQTVIPISPKRNKFQIYEIKKNLRKYNGILLEFNDILSYVNKPELLILNLTYKD